GPDARRARRSPRVQSRAGHVRHAPVGRAGHARRSRHRVDGVALDDRAPLGAAQCARARSAPDVDAARRAGDAVVLTARVLLVVALMAVAVPATVPGQPRGATIRGRVEFPPAPPAVERRPSAGDLGDAPARGVPDRRAVVYFESAPRGAFEDRDGRATLDQRNETFVPHVLAITVGTTVDFPNNDRTYHNVFSLSRTRRFDLGRYAAGRSKSVR